MSIDARPMSHDQNFKNLIADYPRDAIELFAAAEAHLLDTDPRRFSIRRLAHYCLDLTDMLSTERVVPVVIFLRPGPFPRDLRLGTELNTFLEPATSPTLWPRSRPAPTSRAGTSSRA